MNLIPGCRGPAGVLGSPGTIPPGLRGPPAITTGRMLIGDPGTIGFTGLLGLTGDAGLLGLTGIPGYCGSEAWSQ